MFKDLEGPLREDVSQIWVQNQETRKQGTSGQKWLSGQDFRDQAADKQGVMPGPEAEVRHNRWIDGLYPVSGPSIFHMSGSGLDAGDPEWRKSRTPGASRLW